MLHTCVSRLELPFTGTYDTIISFLLLYCSKSSHLWWDVISSAFSLVTANASFSTDWDRDVAVCADTVSSPESKLFVVTAFAATVAAVDICSVIFDWIPGNWNRCWMNLFSSYSSELDFPAVIDKEYPATETGAGWISSAVIHLS